MFISFLGIQGSGKGTQARILQDKYNFKIFETGAFIRKIAKEDTDLGRKIKTLIDGGNLVPIEVIEEILATYMKGVGKNHNVIFDGIPRNQVQKEIFEKYVEDAEVIYFELDKTDAIDRITKRTICSNCNKTFAHDYTHETCASCSGEIVKRADDLDVQAIENRINTFQNETMPVVYEFKGKGSLITINAAQSLEDVSKEISQKLNIKK